MISHLNAKPRRLAAAALLLLFVATQPACWVYSANSLAESDDQVTFDSNLLGSWVQPDTGCSVRIARFFEERFYRLDYAAPPTKKGDGCLLDPGHSASFEARLVEIGDNRFLDVLPADRQTQHHAMSLHSFYRLRVDSTALVLTPLKRDWVHSQVAGERLGLSGRALAADDDSVVLTSSTHQLRDFLRDYGNSTDAFAPDPRLVFQRRTER